MEKKAISARIDKDTLIYIKGCHQPVNTLINTLLIKWVKDRQNKDLLIWKEDTGQDELSQMKAKNDFKCSQSCNNCKYNTLQIECRKGIHSTWPKNQFCCIYWEKKKGSH